MFTIEQIEAAHQRVHSGTDFPQYLRELKALGVRSFETWVKDSHTRYTGEHNYEIESSAQYPSLGISSDALPDLFKSYLYTHQQGETDYFTFCRHCAETGITKWIVDVSSLTCTYYDSKGEVILSEPIPS